MMLNNYHVGGRIVYDIDCLSSCYTHTHTARVHATLCTQYAGRFPIPNTNSTGDMYVFFYSMTGGAKNNTYGLFVDTASKLPAMFYFLGYDKLFGSHYDQYYLNYQFVSASFDDTIFDYYSSEW